MVCAPHDACQECNGTHYVLDIENSEVDERGWPTHLAEKPCPTCNPHGMKPKVRY
jgi:hypothetical protein